MCFTDNPLLVTIVPHQTRKMESFYLVFLALAVQVLVASNATARLSKWKTLDGSPPLVIARGGFSGLFPDSSTKGYEFAVTTSVPDLVLWCDVQLTKDGVGFCFPNLMMNNGSNIDVVYPTKTSSYIVDGVLVEGYFPIDFTFRELGSVFLTQGLVSRPRYFDDLYQIVQTVKDVFVGNKPAGFWLNIQHDDFYRQHNLSMRNFVISASKKMTISHISSPDMSFLWGLKKAFASSRTKMVLRFLDRDATEPSTNQTYGSVLKNLTFIKSIASGILVPKSYIWPLDANSYLLPHTSLVADAHSHGLQIFTADFANDNVIAHNYSYNPVAEHLYFIDNGDFSVDGLLSDFPITSSAARECFAHLGRNATKPAKPLVISECGASGDYPGCTDLSYTNAIMDGTDVIECPVQLSKDSIPFCLSSVDLMPSTQVIQTHRDQLMTVMEIQSNPGIFSFSLNWSDIQALTPVLSNPNPFPYPYPQSQLFGNPKFKNAGKIISLSDFLELAKSATSLSGVLIKIQNARYLAEKQGFSIKNAVLSALHKADYNSPDAKSVMIQSTDSALLKALQGRRFELLYEIKGTIGDALSSVITDIKSFADSVVINKESVFPVNEGFVTDSTYVVKHFQSFMLPVYVRGFRNEYVTIPYDCFFDPNAEINSYNIIPTAVDGIITAYPRVAVAYKRNHCLKMEYSPTYMDAMMAGSLLSLVSPDLMPTDKDPYSDLTYANVSEAPLSPVVPNTSTITSSPAEATITSAKGQPQCTMSALISLLLLVMGVCL